MGIDTLEQEQMVLRGVENADQPSELELSNLGALALANCAPCPGTKKGLLTGGSKNGFISLAGSITALCYPKATGAVMSQRVDLFCAPSAKVKPNAAACLPLVFGSRQLGQNPKEFGYGQQ